MRAADPEWLKAIQEIAKRHDILLIADDIQAGCGRTGTFFSFEPAGITPDIVCLSKSLSGFGLPLSVNLINPEIDCWNPGEHNGAFRGNNNAFITASCALDYWITSDFSEDIESKSELIASHFSYLNQVENITLKGRGLMRGLQFDSAATNTAIFGQRVLMDTCGYNNDVIKIMPPINISEADLLAGLEIISSVINTLIPTSIINRDSYV
jgi:diaminobutyrate-2-oxoglutarate transaminase